MKKSNFLKSLAFAAIFSGGAAQAAPELIVNGGFETTLNGTFSGYRTVNNGSGDIVGWNVGLTSVDLINGNYGAIGGNSIDMLGTPGPGSLSQTFVTIAGASYQLDFDLSLNGVGSSPLDVTFDGQTNTLSGTPTVTHYTQNYTATTTSTTVSFVANSLGNAGSVLDNVSVTAVPEPETYAMLLAGLGLVGFMSRRKSAKKAA